MLLTNDLWKKIAAALIVYLVSKNQRIWRAVWAAIAAHAWLSGYTRGRATERPKLQDVIQLRHPEAKRYFETRGPEFVKTMTDTDLVRLKDQIVEGWRPEKSHPRPGAYLAQTSAHYLPNEGPPQTLLQGCVVAGHGKKTKGWRIRDGAPVRRQRHGRRGSTSRRGVFCGTRQLTCIPFRCQDEYLIFKKDNNIRFNNHMRHCGKTA
jgi:hypothetical protein